jgi:hypothetical protein
MTEMYRIGNNAMKTNLVHGKVFSDSPIGDWLMNTQQLISTRQQASATQNYFIVTEGS